MRQHNFLEKAVHLKAKNHNSVLSPIVSSTPEEHVAKDNDISSQVFCHHLADTEVLGYVDYDIVIELAELPDEVAQQPQPAPPENTKQKASNQPASVISFVVDTGSLPLNILRGKLHLALGSYDYDYLIYATSNSTKEQRQWIIILPVQGTMLDHTVNRCHRYFCYRFGLDESKHHPLHSVPLPLKTTRQNSHYEHYHNFGCPNKLNRQAIEKFRVPLALQVVNNNEKLFDELKPYGFDEADKNHLKKTSVKFPASKRERVLQQYTEIWISNFNTNKSMVIKRENLARKAANQFLLDCLERKNITSDS